MRRSGVPRGSGNWISRPQQFTRLSLFAFDDGRDTRRKRSHLPVRVFRQLAAFVPGLLPSCNRCPTYLFRRSQGLGAVVGCATDRSKPATTKDGTPQRCVALPRFRKAPASCRSLRPCSLCGFLSGEPQQRALGNALRRRPVLVRWSPCSGFFASVLSSALGWRW
jgi:hypothetical protein